MSNEKKTKSLFKIIDTFLFKQVDQFLESQSYQKISEKLSELDSHTQKSLNHLLNFVIILIPCLFVFLFYQGNQTLKEELQIKKDTLSSIHNFRQYKAQVDALSISLNSPVSISSRSDLESKISTRTRNLNIPANKLRIQDFESHMSSDTLMETIVKFNLSEMTMTQFSNFLTIALNEFRMKASVIDLSLNSSTDLIGGMLEFIHLAKVETSEPN